MSKSSKKKIQQSSNSNKEQDTIVLDFAFPTSLVSVNVDGFNNYMKNDDEAFTNVNFCLNNLTALSSTVTPATIKNVFGNHYHPLKNDNLLIFEKAVIEAIRKVYPDYSKTDAENFYDQNLKDAAIYQLGLQKGVRLLGYLDRGHHFKVVLIDYHHSLYPDQNYNEDDTDRYSVCFYERGKKQ